MKTKLVALMLVAALALSTGCSSKPAANADKQPAKETTATTQAPAADVVTTASIVNSNDAFEKALTAEGGHYVVATLNDLTFDKELVVNGDFKSGKKDEKTGAELFQRKIALYTQDKDRNVTAKFTLTAPKITFNSNFGSLEHGTFKGDVYVAGTNFKLVNQTIEGNIYFLNEEAQKTFIIKDSDKDTKTVITGKQELVK